MQQQFSLTNVLIKMHACVLNPFSRICLSGTPWTVAHQARPAMGFSRQEHWSGLLCPPPGDLPHPGVEPVSLTAPVLAAGFFTTGKHHTGSPFEHDFQDHIAHELTYVKSNHSQKKMILSDTSTVSTRLSRGRPEGSTERKQEKKIFGNNKSYGFTKKGVWLSVITVEFYGIVKSWPVYCSTCVMFHNRGKKLFFLKKDLTFSRFKGSI